MLIVKRSVAGREGGRDEQVEHTGFLGSGSTPYNTTTMVDRYHYTFAQTHAMYNTKSEP